MYLINELIALLAVNLILMQALGTSTLFIAADNRRNLVGTALVITFFTTAGSAAAYGINSALPEKYSDLTLLFYTLTVGILYLLLLTLMYFISGEKFRDIRKYIHVSAFNCAVMGTLFTVSGNAAENAELNTFCSFVWAGAKAGIGFIIAALILTAAYRKLNSAKVPASFRGFPAMLVYLGIISMAVYSLK
jgi:electron transport complex protein RnfA